MFTVKHSATFLIPGFQLDDHGEPRAELQPTIAALEAGVESWSLWRWLTAPTNFLSGGIPEQVARTLRSRWFEQPNASVRSGNRAVPEDSKGSRPSEKKVGS